MSNILTATEAANVLRTTEDDPLMVDLLPAVDAYIEQATGRDWAADNPVNPIAKSAARMLVAQWHGDPAMIGSEGGLSHGLSAVLAQLEVIALQLADESA